MLKKKHRKKPKNRYGFQGRNPFRHNNSGCYESTFSDKIDKLYLQNDYEHSVVKKSKKEIKTRRNLALKIIPDSRESLFDSEDFSNLDFLFDVNDEIDVSDETEDSTEELLKDLLKSLEKPEEPKNETHQER